MQVLSPPEVGVQFAPSDFLGLFCWAGLSAPCLLPAAWLSNASNVDVNGGRDKTPPMLFNQCSPRLGLLTSASFAFPMQNVSENLSALLFSLGRCPLKKGLLVRILVSS